MAESLEREIRDLRILLFSQRDPDGRGFAPLADALRRAGDLTQALELVEDGVSRLPDFATGHVVSGWVHRARGDDDEAERSFRRVLELDEENVSALRGLGFLLADRGAGREALEVFRRLDDLDPGDLEVQARLLELADAPVATAGAGRSSSFGSPGGGDVQSPVVSIAALAPDDGDLPLVDITVLAPGWSIAPAGVGPTGATDGTEVGEVVDVATLAPEARPTEDVGSEEKPPADEDEAAADGTVVDMAELAPDLPEEDWESQATGEPDERAGADEEVDAEAASADASAGDPGEEETDGHVVSLPQRAQSDDAGSGGGTGDGGEGPWTRTMAELYARQGATDRAAGIYRRLLEGDPDDERLRARLQELEGGSRAASATPTPVLPVAGGDVDEDEDTRLEELAREMASGPEVEGPSAGPFAWGGAPGLEEDEDREEETAAEGTAASEYLRTLLSWQPSGEGSGGSDGASEAADGPDEEGAADASSPGPP